MDTIKEKDIAQNTTIQWIRGLDEAGNPIKINAGDLAEVIRINMTLASDLLKGLLPSGIIIDNGLFVKATSISNYDLNELHCYFDNGMIVGTVMSSTPIVGAGVVLHIQRANKGNISSSQYLFQLHIGAGSIRIRNGNGNGEIGRAHV